MNIGFDYYHTLTDDHRMIEMVKLLGYHNLYLISAYGDRQMEKGNYLDTLKGFLEENGITKYFNEIVPIYFEYPEQIAELKLEACQDWNIDMFFDDRLDVCEKLRANGILALQYTREKRKI